MSPGQTVLPFFWRGQPPFICCLQHGQNQCISTTTSEIFDYYYFLKCKNLWGWTKGTLWTPLPFLSSHCLPLTSNSIMRFNGLVAINFSEKIHAPILTLWIGSMSFWSSPLISHSALSSPVLHWMHATGLTLDTPLSEEIAPSHLSQLTLCVLGAGWRSTWCFELWLSCSGLILLLAQYSNVPNQWFCVRGLQS